MRSIRTLLACFAFLVAQAAVAAPDRRVIERAVSALVTQFSDGIAVNYPEARHIAFGQMFGTDSQDAIAFFGIEGLHGGNNFTEYVAFFTSVPPDAVAGRRTRPFRLIAVAKIGERGWRTFNWRSVAIKSEEITVSGKEWRNDALCCPSEFITATFRIDNGSIVETK